MTMERKRIKYIIAAVLFFITMIFSFSFVHANESHTEGSITYYITYNAWQRDVNPDGSKNYTFDETTDQIEYLLKAGLAKVKKGESGTDSEAYECIKEAYYSWYDSCGFERNVQVYISGARVTATELQCSACRKDVKNGEGYEKTESDVNTLISMLREDAEKLDAILYPNAKKSDSSSSLGWANFIGVFGILMREGLEAILIVSAMVAYLLKEGNKKGVRFVYLGAVLAIALSFLLAWLISLFDLSGMPQEIIEGVTALVAVVVMVYTSNWMISKSEAQAWTKFITGQVKDENTNQKSKFGKIFAVSFASFLAVFREGAEVILFIQPLIIANNGSANVAIWGGIAAGFAVILIIFFLIRIFSVKIPVKPFFMATSILMAIMSIAFIGAGFQELFIDGGICSVETIKGLEWMADNDVLNFFGIYPTWLTLIPQFIMLVISVVTFVLHLKKNKKAAAAAAATAAEAQNAEVQLAVDNATEVKEEAVEEITETSEDTTDENAVENEKEDSESSETQENPEEK